MKPEAHRVPPRALNWMTAQPPQHRTAQRLAAQLVRTDGLGAPKTVSCLHQLPSTTIGAVFELINASVVSEVVYHAAFALSASANDWFTPAGPDGGPNNALWVPVTLNGQTSITVPAAVSSVCPARIVSDVMMFPAPPPVRIDGGGGVCLFFRQCAITHTGTARVFDESIPRWHGYRNGQNPAQFSQTFGGGWALPGDYATSGHYAAAADRKGLGPYAVPNTIIPVMSGPALCVMSVGDSILSGAASQENVDMGVAGAGFQLAGMLNRPGRPALHLNEAVVGMTSEASVQNAALTLAHVSPDVMLLQTWSANDDGQVPSREGVWQAFQRTMYLAAMAAGRGARVLLVTSPPFSGADSPRPAAEWEAVRCYANSLALNSGTPCVDADEVLGTGTGPVSYRPGLSPDGVHPGHAASGLLAAAAFRTLYAVYGVS